MNEVDIKAEDLNADEFEVVELEARFEMEALYSDSPDAKYACVYWEG